MEIIFVRHAETKNNVYGIIQGPEHGDINENGKRELKKVSKLLKNEEIDIIYSSDIPRCKITSERINRFHKLQINFTKLIREKYNGDWTGKKYKEVDWDQLEGTFESRKVDNGESLLDVKARAREFINKLLKDYGNTNKKILVVSHGAFIKILIGVLLNMDIKSSIFNLKINHCSPIRISFKEIVFENKRHKNVPTISL